MARGRGRSAKNRKRVTYESDKKHLDAGSSGEGCDTRNSSNKVAEQVDLHVPETDDDEVETAELREIMAATSSKVVCESDTEDAGLQIGHADRNSTGEGKTQSKDEGTTVYYKLRAAMPNCFTESYMEEVYWLLCVVKHAAGLASQEILECVTNIALGWLRLAFKKIHSKDVSNESCHVPECQVMSVLQSLLDGVGKFPSTLDSLAETLDGGLVVKKNLKRKEKLESQQSPLENCNGHNKYLPPAEETGQPPHKKSKMDVDQEGYDDEEEEREEQEEEEEQEAVKSWKEFYNRPSNEDTPARIVHLSEHFRLLQTFQCGMLPEDEALAYTRRVHKMMESLDSESDKIDCLLDDEKIWQWVHSRIETEFSGRTLQNYLLSLEEFYNFVWHRHRKIPSYTRPPFSKKTRELAKQLAEVCPNWRRSVCKIAAERRWKRLVTDPVYMQPQTEEGARGQQLIQRNSKETSPYEIHRQKSHLPRRKKWNKEDASLLKKYFTENPGRKEIIKKVEEVKELQKLVQREGLERCLEKVKSLFRNKQ